MTPDRRGFVLPFVLLAVATGSLLAFALVNDGWQSARAVRLAETGSAALDAAEEGQALALAHWEVDSVWATPPGGIATRRVVTAGGRPVDVEWQRTHPLVAILRTRAGIPGTARRGPIQRELLRAVWLHAPHWPIPAALTVTGSVTGQQGTLLSGLDVPTPASPCGMVRDTSSVAALAARAVSGDPVTAWPGQPPHVADPPGLADSIASTLPRVSRRASIVSLTGPTPFPVRNGWQALVLTGLSVVIEGPTLWRGLVVVEGPLTMRGTVTIEGVLAVRGPLDARAAQLLVRGAVVVVDPNGGGAELGAASRIFYDRCAIQMALATVARPALRPFSLWQSLSR
ncbi:MAG: hypothetical protein HEQ38_10505 [Gemmatimonas sp.]|jgi:hypothetical protein|uniref:hypothetical protein n=1 Tax=Gemmatimonas sp. TaxID=1962908 RepID=UPI0031C3A450|nr:hypothetical protein [Gemmatimonas sp.]